MNEDWNKLPEQFIKLVHELVPTERLDDVLQAFTKQRISTFRVNTLKTTKTELEEELRNCGIEFEAIPEIENAYRLTTTQQKTLTTSQPYLDGKLYVQGLSSMIPPLVLDPQSEDLILDITAAPGSKTTQIAALMNNLGKIIANDKSRVRIYKLEANLKGQGVTNTAVTYMEGQAMWKRYPEYFDRALVDVPCSLEGTFYSEYTKSYQDWSPRKVKELAQAQRYLLRSAVSATRPGGIIVYSTCTLEPAENEEIINWLLKTEGDAIEVVDIDIKLPEMMDGITTWRSNEFDPSISKTKRILPSNKYEGFYVAKLQKRKSTINNK